MMIRMQRDNKVMDSVYVDKNGYEKIYNPTNVVPDKDGCVYVHRMVMEKFLGRKLNSDETVHHINGVKTDNRIENLQLMTNAEHMRLHRIEDFEKNGKNAIKFKAIWCKQDQFDYIRSKKIHRKQASHEILQMLIDKAEAYDREHELNDRAMNNDVEITED